MFLIKVCGKQVLIYINVLQILLSKAYINLVSIFMALRYFLCVKNKTKPNHKHYEYPIEGQQGDSVFPSYIHNLEYLLSISFHGVSLVFIPVSWLSHYASLHLFLSTHLPVCLSVAWLWKPSVLWPPLLMWSSTCTQIFLYQASWVPHGVLDTLHLNCSCMGCYSSLWLDGYVTAFSHSWCFCLDKMSFKCPSWLPTN